jgi:hypothetical protein
MKLEHLDFISPSISFYYNGFLKHTSIYSIIISLLSLIFILIFSVIFSLDFFLKKNPTTFFYRKFIYDAGFFPLNSSGIFHFLVFGTNNFDRRAYSIVGVNFKHENLLEDNNETHYDHYIYDFCDEKDIGNRFEYLAEYENLYLNGICIKQFYNSTSKKITNIRDDDFNHSFIQFGASNPNEIFYGLYIKRCENNSIINSDFYCYDEHTIDDYIQNAFNYSILFIDQNIDVDDYHIPLKYFFHKINNDIIKESYTLNALNFHPCRIKTRTGILFEAVHYHKSYVYDENEKLVYLKNSNNKNIFGSVYFSMQNMEDIYDRKYKMLQDISGSIAGIANLIFIMAKILNYFFNLHAIFSHLIRDIERKYIKLGIKIQRIPSIFKSNNNIKQFNLDSIEKPVFKNNYINKIENEKENENERKNENKSISNSNCNFVDNRNKKIFTLKKRKSQNIYQNKSSDDVFFDKKKFHKKYVKYKNFFIFFWSIIGCSSNHSKSVNKLIEFREGVLSEEEMFRTHFFINSLSGVMLNVE